jgi:hypothetical protein
MFKVLLTGLLTLSFLKDLHSEKLVILTPHRKSITREYEERFRVYYKNLFQKEVTLEFIDQGGTENDLRFLDVRFQKQPLNPGIDLFWGGGNLSFDEL